jgi:5-hydroxyisourate hydrolase
MIEINDHGRITTHVLDTARGCPAGGIKVTLFRLTGETREVLASAVTNDDGRCEAPLVQGAEMIAGHYELLFHAGDYLRSTGAQKSEILFLDQIPIRFGVLSADQHYHVPLLLSPFGYSTYRGS